MMRLWLLSYARPRPVRNAVVLSLVAHTLIIASWVEVTRPLDSMPDESIANRLYYLPPPDREMVARGSRETVHYFTLAPGPDIGPGPTVSVAQKPAISVPEHSPQAGERAVDSVTAPPVIGEPEGDSVFTILEVDSAVVRSQSSAAPAYPLDLLTKKVQGSVNARYVVDTTGFADTTSFEVLTATNPGFVQAVRDALPYMRFTSAKIGTRKVRQVVEQSFTFKITPPTPAPVAPKP
jgi:hypothetical protein